MREDDSRAWGQLAAVQRLWRLAQVAVSQSEGSQWGIS